MKRSKESILMEYLASAQTISLGEAMNLLAASESTVRRLFHKLEMDGLVFRSRYGIQLIQSTTPITSFEDNSHRNMDQKRAIAREAAKLVESGDLLYCDPGTTVYCFCEKLLERVQTEKDLKVRLVTNSLMLLGLLSPYMPVILLSGEYNVSHHSVTGELSQSLLQRLYFSKCFLGTEGYANGQFYTRSTEGANFVQCAIRNSQQRILLMDSSKFNLTTRVAFAREGDIDRIVIDDYINPDVQRRLQSKFTSVLVAKTNTDLQGERK